MNNFKNSISAEDVLRQEHNLIGLAMNPTESSNKTLRISDFCTGVHAMTKAMLRLLEEENGENVKSSEKDNFISEARVKWIKNYCECVNSILTEKTNEYERVGLLKEAMCTLAIVMGKTQEAP